MRPVDDPREMGGGGGVRGQMIQCLTLSMSLLVRGLRVIIFLVSWM